MRARIRTQAYLISALPLAFLVVLLAIGLQIQQESVRAGALEQHTQHVLAQLDSIRSELALMSRAAGAYAQNRSHPGDSEVAASAARIRASIADLRRVTADDPGTPPRIAALASTLERGIALVQTYVADLRARNTKAAAALSSAPSTRALADALQRSYDSVTNAERRQELGKLVEARTRTVRYEIALIVVCLAGIAITLFVSGRFGVGIAQRLGHLAENARRLAAGESAEELRGSDEFADLDRVYQAMMMRIAREHRIASTLQKMLLPQRMPQIPGVRIDSVYVPAAQDAEVGGDWYDVFPISPERICITIGDVAGHGLRSATVMAGARLAMRTAARIDARPAAIMAHVNRIVCEDEPETIVTAVVAVLDLRDGSLRYAIAGHPEPMVVGPDGEIDLLPGKGLVLGADPRAAYDTFETVLEEGSALLLYTDGLIEIEHDYFKGLDELMEAAQDAYRNASENIAEAIQRRAVRDRRPADDAALLFVGVTSLSQRVQHSMKRSWTLDARDAETARRTKRAVLWHLGEMVRDPDALASAELVLGELLGNVARHSPGQAEIVVDRNADGIQLSVRDRGAAFNPNGSVADPFAESGRGLFLVQAMTTRLTIEHDGGGNTVTAVVPVASAAA